MDDEVFVKAIEFVKVACEVSKDAALEAKVTFICPVCGSDAYVIKAGGCGHRHGACTGCDMNFME